MEDLMVGAISSDDFNDFASFSSYESTSKAYEYDHSANDLQQTVRKTSTAFCNIKPYKVGGSVEGGVNVNWGGKEGTQVSGYANGEMHDDKGNYGQVQFTQNGDGTGNVNFSGGHKEDEK